MPDDHGGLDGGNARGGSFNKAYNGLVYTGFTVRYSGFVNGETPSVLGGSLTFSGAGTTAALPGTYTVTPGGLTSTNYAITFNNGTLNIGYGTCNGSDPGGVILPPINADGQQRLQAQGGQHHPSEVQGVRRQWSANRDPAAVLPQLSPRRPVDHDGSNSRHG